MKIWLRGERWNIAYHFDTISGEWVRMRFRFDVGALAGLAIPSNRGVIGIYCREDGSAIVQVGAETWVIDGTETVESTPRVGGLWSTLRISRPGQTDLKARVATPWRWFGRHMDIAYDDMDDDDNDPFSLIWWLSTDDETKALLRQSDLTALPVPTNQR